MFCMAPELRPLFIEAAVEGGLTRSASVEAAERVRFVTPIAASAARVAWHAPVLAVARRQRVSGITLGCWVYIADPAWLDHAPLIAHEAAHVAQVLERGLVRFLTVYGAEFLGAWVRQRDGYAAYFSLSDEVQARDVEARVARRFVARASVPAPV